MKYRELKITVDRDELELCQAELTEAGFTGLMIDDPDDIRDILEHPGLYKYDYINEDLTRDMSRLPVITIYFTDDEEGASELARAEELVRNIFSARRAGIAMTSDDAGDDSDWLYKWQEHFKPTKVGERIVVKPGWEDYEARPGELVIEMEPGMAFGSGLHETTSMCIRALEKIMAASEYPEQEEKAEEPGHAFRDEASGPAVKVLDVGTGTGILAIAAARLGADESLGIDIDTDAVRVAEENILKNGLEGKIRVRYGDLTEGTDYKADIIVANLMADLVIRLSPAASEHLRQGGWYITSGILDIKEEVVCKAIEDAGFDIAEVMSDGEWRAVIARKI